MTEFSSCLSSLVFGRTRGGAVFFFRSPYEGSTTESLAIETKSVLSRHGYLELITANQLYK